MQETWKYWPFVLAAIALVSALISYLRDRRFERRARTLKQDIKPDKRATMFLVAAAFLIVLGVANWS